MEDAWRGLEDNLTLYKNLVNMKSNSGTNAAKAQRNVFHKYFMSKAEIHLGIPWQIQSVIKRILY